MFKLMALFILVPIIELALLIQLGKHVGLLPTLALIAFTGMLGASLARHQGMGVLRQIQHEMHAGKLPAAPVFDGLIILIAGALLLTPGILTDATGFLCLIPATRNIIKKLIWHKLEDAIRQGKIQVNMQFNASSHQEPKGPIHDINAEPVRPDADEDPTQISNGRD